MTQSLDFIITEEPECQPTSSNLYCNCPLTSLDFEDEIAAALGNPRDEASHAHIVDGNSFGGGTIEFFIHTTDPQAAFDLCKPLLESAALMRIAVVAFRRFTEDSFTVIWPTNFVGVFTA